MNIYDIAKKANVSVATVSRVINKSGPVRKSTQIKVENAISEMHYTPSSIARSLSNRKTDNIGIIVPDIFNPFYARILAGITSVVHEIGYNMFLFNAEENADRLHEILQTVQGENLKGIILNPISTQDERTLQLTKQIEERGVPIVLLDRDVYGFNSNGVYSDDFGGAYKAVSHLIKIGHRKIAIFRGPMNSRPGYERFAGYRKALEDNGITLEEDLIGDYDFMLSGLVYEQTKKLMKRKKHPTAIFTSNNNGTLECMKSLLDMGFEIGKDVGLIGFDDIDLLHYTNMAISVVDRRVEDMGAEAMSLLRSCIEDKEDEDRKQQIVMDTHLVLRGSEKCTGIGKPDQEKDAGS